MTRIRPTLKNGAREHAGGAPGRGISAGEGHGGEDTAERNERPREHRILLHYAAGKPVFLHNSTFPHQALVTCAHCTSPRRMDGKKYEPVRVMTHCESDFGAAPKVEMKLGQVCTNLVPDFSCRKWVGFEASIVGNPFLDICRSQVDVKVHGNADALLEQMKGFHWMLSYGDYLRECGYGLKKLGIEFLNVSAPAKVA